MLKDGMSKESIPLIRKKARQNIRRDIYYPIKAEQLLMTILEEGG